MNSKICWLTKPKKKTSAEKWKISINENWTNKQKKYDWILRIKHKKQYFCLGRNQFVEWFIQIWQFAFIASVSLGQSFNIESRKKSTHT